MAELSEDLRNLQVSDQIFKSIKFFVSGDVHEKVLELLKGGGAERMNYFSDYVTHLVCGTDAEETDVSDANDLYEIPAVAPKWIFMCAKLNRLISTKPYLYDNKKLFSNLVFCFSKISIDRNALWSIITYNGGIVQLNFDRRCTHLVTIGTTSAKYIKAFSMGASRVEIVTPDWIVESVQNKSLVQADLFHPKLIILPKVVKHESTTAITGFEPEPAEFDEKTPDNNTPDSTQALLDKLKQRMPWNQPPPPPQTITKEIVPPNVIAPSFTATRLPITSTVQQNLQQAQQQRAFTQQLVQSSFPNPVQSQTQPSIVSANPIARSVVHHTAQGNLIGQPQPQLNQFNQATQVHLAQNRLQQQQQQQRALLSQLNQQQLNRAQFAGQQIIRTQMGQIAQVTTQQAAQIAQTGQISQGQIGPNQVGQLGPNVGQIGSNQVGQIGPNQVTQIGSNQVIGASQVGQIGSSQIGPNQISQIGQISANQVGASQIGLNQMGQIGTSQAPSHLGQIGQPTPQLGQLVGQNQSIIQRAQMGQLGKTPVSIQQLQQQLANRQQLSQTLAQQQQSFVNVSQQQQQSSQPLLSQPNQNSPFVNINQQQQQQLGQVLSQSQQHLGIQQKTLLQSQFGQQNQNQNPPQETQPQFVQQQQQFNQAQQFAQSGQPQQAFNQGTPQQVVQNQFVQSRPQSQFSAQALLSQQQQQQLVNQQQQQLVSQQQQQQQQQLVNQQQQQLVSQQQQQQQQLVSQQQQQHVNQQQLVNQQLVGNQQMVNTSQQLVGNQQLQLVNQAQLMNQQQQHLGNQQVQPSAQQQLITQQQQINKQLLLNQSTPQVQTIQAQPAQPNSQPNQPKPLWQQQQQQQQISIRHSGIIQQQQQGPRIQWSPTQQQPAVPQRQFIHLDAQTHQQLQQMAPEQRALFIAKLQKQRQIFLQRQQMQQMQAQQQQQQRTGHVLIRSGPVPQGLNPQQQIQWLQQQAKQQGVMLQQPAVQQPTITPANVVQNASLTQNIQHAPGLSPIQQNAPQFNNEQNQLQLQRQQQFRIQQLQLQREQAQKAAAAAAAAVVTVTPSQPPLPQPNIIRPIGQPQTAEIVNTTTVVDSNVAQQQLVVNAKTKTALANMLSIRLQSGGSTMGPTPDNLTEPSAAGTLRLMTAQHNAALNSNNRPQDILGLPQRRAISGPNGELIRPAPAPSAPPTPTQNEPPKLQYSPRNSVPVQHRQGPFYGHNPNLKLPPDLFLLGCIFVVVELDRFLEKSLPHWQEKIEKHGGEVEKQYCNRVTHVLCETQRHGVVMQALRDCKRCVTIYWLMDVIQRKQVLPPWTALHLPTMYVDTTPASKHLISLTGFMNSDRHRIKDMIKYVGATCTSYFSKHNTLLIASKADGQKVQHAKKWGTPVVNVQWLTDVMLGNFSALNQMEHIKYQQFANPPVFSFEPTLVPSLMHAWKMPINISQESYERVKRSPSPVLLPKKPKKIKTEPMTEENEMQEDQTIPSFTHRVLFSMFTDTEDLKKIVKDLGGSLAKSHADCTHLVMPYLARSNKLLYCICLGVHILPESWLRDSQAANKFLDHSNYSLDTKEFNSEYKCDFNQTLATRNRGKLFEGKCFYITPSVYPSKSVLTELIRSCGGVVEKNRRTAAQIEATNINSPYSYIILTHANDLHLVYDVLRNKKDTVRTVCNVELIYSAILKQTFEVEPYAVQVCER